MSSTSLVKPGRLLSWRLDSDESFALNGLGALLRTAAEHSPDHVLVEDDEGASTAGQLARRARRLTDQLLVGGLQRGERVLIVASAQTSCVVALIAVLQAGLEPVLVPCGDDAVALAAFAQAADVVALIGPSRYGDLVLGDVYLSAAAVAERVRGLLTYGPDHVDGASDISFAALDATPGRVGPTDPEKLETPIISTFGGSSMTPMLRVHRQETLLADALWLVEQARITPSDRIISLLSPASLAWLVGGLFAAFVGASRLVLHGPFSASRFLAHCDREPGYHVLAPAAVGAVFAHTSLAGSMGSLILASRFADANAFALPRSIACGRPVIDLYALEEKTVIAQCRRNGEASPPMRVDDLRVTDGLGARLNRARAEYTIAGLDGAR